MPCPFAGPKMFCKKGLIFRTFRSAQVQKSARNYSDGLDSSFCETKEL